MARPQGGFELELGFVGPQRDARKHRSDPDLAAAAWVDEAEVSSAGRLAAQTEQRERQREGEETVRRVGKSEIRGDSKSMEAGGLASEQEAISTSSMALTPSDWPGWPRGAPHPAAAWDRLGQERKALKEALEQPWRKP